jgi:hypothetical protein
MGFKFLTAPFLVHGGIIACFFFAVTGLHFSRNRVYQIWRDHQRAFISSLMTALPKTGYLTNMSFEPLIRLCQAVGSTSRAAGSYKPR